MPRATTSVLLDGGLVLAEAPPLPGVCDADVLPLLGVFGELEPVLLEPVVLPLLLPPLLLLLLHAARTSIRPSASPPRSPAFRHELRFILVPPELSHHQ